MLWNRSGSRIPTRIELVVPEKPVESLKIIAASLIAAVGYGILHDEITARVCLPYFTVLHPDIFHTQSPTLLGLAWGTYATWPVGLVLGILFAICARFGRRPQLALRDLIPLLLRLLGIMAVCATLSAILGYFFGSMPAHSYYHLILMNPAIRAGIPVSMEHRFVADLWATIGSFAAGITGGLICCFLIHRRRGVLTVGAIAAGRG